MNNPAEKLLSIILELKQPQYGTHQIRKIWKDVLDLSNRPTADLYRGIASVLDLTNAIRASLNEIDYPISTLNPSLDKIDHVFNTMDFNATGQIFSQHINDDVIRSLEQSKWIIEHPKFSHFDGEELSTLSDLCNELKSLFTNLSSIESIDSELKEFLDIYIAQLISGIESYIDTNDITDLRMAATSAFSILGLDHSILRAAQDADEGIAFRTVLLKIMDFIGYGNDIKQLTDNMLLLASS
ncbi:hypothetical protein [Vibrio crassostreae]|uniref:hypothetical protein n=1 Tax=Vibrio crassostreae TaxID=246167 RepID=UPI00104AB87E|nr:hypothetical protein [Vibrio crassostreae]TCT68621.1 hypothetical protein EDB46_11940 [Vibrio crassostreae]CAK2429266.1 hypothetical protein VCRA2111O136_170057 [Vibrio crassostreae]CAK2883015.1 hypothetical protein VCRA217O134_250052 [Vibrio crassostreae]